MIRALLGKFFRAVASTQSARMLALSPPRGALQVHATGDDPVRILMVVDRPSIGPGAASQELGFAGHLSRQLAVLFGRGVDLDILSEGDLTTVECAAALSKLDLSRFDALVLMVGSSEALGLTPGRRWTAALAELLDGIRLRGWTGLHTFVVAIAPVEAMIGFPRAFAPLAGASIRRLNAASAAIFAERTDASFLRFEAPPAPPEGRNTNASYSAWAALIAPSISRELAKNRPVRVQRSVDEFDRQRALESIQVLDTYPSPSIDRLVFSARNLFGTSSAALTFLDRQRRWVKSAIGTGWHDSLRSDSLCNLAIQEPGVFVVEDTAHRGSELPSSIRASDVRFYAGYPIEAPSGHRVGVLCIMDSKPREFGPIDSALLRNIALRIQAELWRV